MVKCFKYLRYVVRHKFFVLVECWKRGLYWRGLTHDVSKLRPSEFFPYANHFYGSGDKAFDFAWLLHQKRNRHHWQWWVLHEDEGGVKVLEMGEVDRLEMLCDWIGAGKAQGHTSPAYDPLYETRAWWVANNHKMQLHPETRLFFNRLLGVTRHSQKKTKGGVK